MKLPFKHKEYQAAPEAVLRENPPVDDTEAFVAAFSRGNNTDSPVGKVHHHEICDRPILHRL